MTYSDSSNSGHNSDDSDGGDRAGFGYPPAKRRRTKESAMLGVFGSDSDEEDARASNKTMRYRAPAFEKSALLEPEEVIKARSASPPRATFAKASVADEPAPTIKPAAFGQFGDDAPANPSKARHSFAQAPTQTARKGKQEVPSKLKSSKGARMMAMMGYKEGTGLGVGESGIVNPIEAEQRVEAKAGLGAGSAPEGKRDQGRKQGKVRTRPVQGSLEDGYEASDVPAKIKYKTAKEVISEAGGNLPLPEPLRHLLDMTGEQPKLIVDGAQRFTTASANQVNQEADKAFQLSQVARREVEMQAVNWKTIQDRRLYAQQEMQRCQRDLESLEQDVVKLESLLAQSSLLNNADEELADELVFSDACNQLASLAVSQADIERLKLDQLCLSLLTPIIRRMLAAWDTLADPGKLDALRKVQRFLLLPAVFDPESIQQPGRTSSAFESFMHTIWFPKIRQVLSLNAWQISDSPRAVRLLEHWSDLTPPFLKAQILTQLVTPKLVASVKEWDARATKAGPLSWLFEWLPYYGPQAVELMDPLKQKLGALLRNWRTSDGLLPELRSWQVLLGGTFVQKSLIKLMLPKLAASLRQEFVVDPGDQDMSIPERVLAWNAVLEPSIMAQLLEAELFPKWQEVLHLWLSSEGNLEEISEWFEWWQGVLPKAVVAQPVIKACFDRGLALMEHALEHGMDQLPALKVGPRKPLDHVTEIERQSAQRKKVLADGAAKALLSETHEVTFKEVVEDWCDGHGFFLLPLRRADEATGKTLFKISASAKGKGGLTVFFQGDLLMQITGDETRPISLTKAEEMLRMV